MISELGFRTASLWWHWEGWSEGSKVGDSKINLSCKGAPAPIEEPGWIRVNNAGWSWENELQSRHHSDTVSRTTARPVARAPTKVLLVDHCSIKTFNRRKSISNLWMDHTPITSTQNVLIWLIIHFVNMLSADTAASQAIPRSLLFVS
jgi:hypothetical protein